MKQYHDLLHHILKNGSEKDDRTKTGTISVFGHQMRFDLNEGFPLVTTKKVYWHGVVEELLWFLRGETNIKSLVEKNVHIWDAWANDAGELGPVYGKQWRDWEHQHHTNDGIYHEHIDQIADVIQQIKQNPDSRRLIVNSWNVGEVDSMALPPCHMFFQFYVNQGKLSCQLYQRSADAFLGVPFNIASYSLLTHMIAQVCDLGVGEFIHTFGDAHIYHSHLTQVDEQLKRDFLPLPKLILNANIKDIDSFTSADIKLENYQHHPAIKAPVSI